MTTTDTRIAFIRGQFVPLAEAVIPVMDRGFLFGDGVYEVTAVIEGRLVDDTPHLARLARSLAEIDIPNPFAAPEWTAIEKELMRRNGLRNGLIYIQVTRGVAERAFAYADGLAPTVVLFPQFQPVQYSPLTKTGARIITLPDQRWTRCDIKSTSLLAQVMAKHAVSQAGAHEAWMTRGDQITEGASSTAYIVTAGGDVITRDLSPAVLPGITRQTILKIARARGLTIVERPFTRAEALAATEAFYTSASTIAIPVATIDGHPIGDREPGPVFQDLYAAYMRDLMDLPEAWPAEDGHG
ncbi:branched-chain amino acid aminotransferase [Gluconacetobacter sacchari DSM 12717]|uniref:Probable branched-chain-amino-acid aminotransferase n=1 Tax=Gluconacetobacter sacchari DSM 12717 TaxID=1307940 RepID=A0ABQ0P7L4_9PROT|nr:D-amino-acid transaminase [Gluconacetobacter sacchari]GBQ25193.1 branched-chain amino acid aminotransferase [Gluconacetobacter sacchari DSM 12717]